MKSNHIVARPTSERSRSKLKPRVERLDYQRRVRFAEESLQDQGNELEMVSEFF